LSLPIMFRSFLKHDPGFSEKIMREQ
jgi:hypothetical protein